MNRSGLGQIGWAVLAALMVSACGGGGGSSPSSTSSFDGTITGFGSVYVNGVKFETDGSSFSIDGEHGSEDDLKVGMRVRVEGSVNGEHGSASSISYTDELEGLVISNSIASGADVGNMNIMGQTVSVTAETVFESKVMTVTMPDQIAAGMIVEVSGYSSGMGEIQATRIEVKASDLTTYLALHPNGIEVKGIVANHDEQNMKFDLGSMTIDYSSAILDDMPNGNFDMLYVEVKSTAGIDSNTSELIASKVELENHGDMGHDGHDDDEMEIKGMITSAIEGDSFAVNGQMITVNDKTEFDDISKAELLVGVMVEVEGYYRDGEFIAEEVEAKEESSDEIEGIIAAIESGEINTGTVTLNNGMVFSITNETIMEDSRDDGFIADQKFNLQALMEGDYVEIHYYDDNGTLVATKLERDDN